MRLLEALIVGGVVSNGISAGAAPATAVAVTDAAQNQGAMVIVYASRLKDAADAWAKYRGAEGGWSIITRAVDASADPQAQMRQIQQFIRQAYEPWQAGDPQHFCVLLLGDADPNNSTSTETKKLSETAVNAANPANFCIPTWHFPQTDPTLNAKAEPEFISDHPYQTLHDGDDVPAFALGRIPARSNEEAL